LNSSFKKTIILKIDPDKPDMKVIRQAARIIESGGFVAFPTETVYGIGVNILDDKAVKSLYKIKNRPAGKPFTVHISDIRQISEAWDCAIGKNARALIDKFWPGALTIILKSGKGDTIGFRMPDNRIAHLLISETKVPIGAPSANISGNTPPVSAEDVISQLSGKIDMILDGGRAGLGMESTIVDMTLPRPKVIRQGAISIEKINELL